MQNNPIVRKIVENLTGRAERSKIELYWDFLFIAVNFKSYLIASLRLNTGKVTLLKAENKKPAA